MEFPGKQERKGFNWRSWTRPGVGKFPPFNIRKRVTEYYGCRDNCRHLQWAEEISQRIYFICVVGGNPICGKEWQWYVCHEKGLHKVWSIITELEELARYGRTARYVCKFWRSEPVFRPGVTSQWYTLKEARRIWRPWDWCLDQQM